MQFINVDLLHQSDIKDLILQYTEILKDMFTAFQNSDAQSYRDVGQNGLEPLNDRVINHEDFDAIVLPMPTTSAGYFRMISALLRYLGDDFGAALARWYATCIKSCKIDI